jgi:Transcriptional regulators
VARGGRRATITDVAELAGVSIKTVSRVINGVSTVDPELVERVRVAVGRLNYRPNQLASALKSGSGTSSIGFIGKRLSSELETTMMLGAETIVRRHAAHLVTASGSESASSDEDIALATELIQRRIDGLLIVPSGGDYAALARERELGVPMVFLDREPRGIEADTVVVDNEGGTEQAIGHLVQNGHERIALLIGGAEIDVMMRRMAGAKRVMKRAGILLSQSPTLVGVSDRMSAAASIGQLLDSATPPTAVFCANSEITIGAIEEVYRRGAELAIAGFDAFRLAELMPVPLTLVATDAYELGRTAAELLYRRLEHPDRPFERIVLPVRIVEFPGTMASRL